MGIMKSLGMSKVPNVWIVMFQNSGDPAKFDSAKFGSAFSFAIFECLSMLSRRVIRRRMTVTAMAIKAGLLVLWCTVLFTCAKGLISW
jgi:hypothetical protein